MPRRHPQATLTAFRAFKVNSSQPRSAMQSGVDLYAELHQFQELLTHFSVTYDE